MLIKAMTKFIIIIITFIEFLRSKLVRDLITNIYFYIDILIFSIPGLIRPIKSGPKWNFGGKTKLLVIRYY